MKSITGKHEVYGVIGDPITHTLSPCIHNAIAEALEHKSIYVPFHVQKGHLEDAIKGAYALGIKGLNVTMPHKQEIMQYLYQIHETAQYANAVNTLVYTEKGYIGYNTDVSGLGYAMAKQGICPKDKRVAIIGSGGAAYAAVLCMEEATHIALYNRTKEKAWALKEHIEKMSMEKTQPGITVHGLDEAPTESYDIVVQTTGVGMGELKGEMPVGSLALLKEATVAIDLIYNPWETVFLKAAREQGIKTMNGFDMLFYQAIDAYEHMHQCLIKDEKKEWLKAVLIKELALGKKE